MALRMVWETARAVRVPVIGMGGISTAQDALEFILAGATAVALGTANFTRPTAMHDTIAGLSRFLDDEGVTDVRELIGALRYDAFWPAATPDARSANGAPDPYAPLGQPAPISGSPGGHNDHD